MTCSQCDRQAKARGLCSAHYKAWQRKNAPGYRQRQNEYQREYQRARWSDPEFRSAKKVYERTRRDLRTPAQIDAERARLAEVERSRPRRPLDRRKRSAIRARHAEIAAALPAPNAGSSWTSADDSVLLRDDLSLLEKAALTGRSYWAASGRRSYLRKSAQKEQS